MLLNKYRWSSVLIMLIQLWYTSSIYAMFGSILTRDFNYFAEVILKYRDKITKMESDIADVLQQEKEEKIMRASEIQVYERMFLV